MLKLTPCRKDRILAAIVRLLSTASHGIDRVIITYDKDGALSVMGLRIPRTRWILKRPVPSREELVTVLELLGFRVTYDEVGVNGEDSGYCTIHSPWEPVKHHSCGSIFYPILKESDHIK